MIDLACYKQALVGSSQGIKPHPYRNTFFYFLHNNNYYYTLLLLNLLLNFRIKNNSIPYKGIKPRPHRNTFLYLIIVVINVVIVKYIV